MFGKTDKSMIRILKPILLTFCKTNAKQAHFISTSLEVISQQAVYIFKLEKEIKKKKATFWSRFKFVIFGKK